MKHRERMATALSGGTPDRVPTMELEFQLPEELIGESWLTGDKLKNASPKERERLLYENAERMLKVYGILEHDAFGVHYLSESDTLEQVRILRKLSGDQYMIFAHGDGTFSLPDGNRMYEFSYRLADEPEKVHEEAERMCRAAIACNRRRLEAGFDCLILCADYCFNKGPFLSPRMFSEFVAPYLTRIIADIRANGGYAIKHTDGDIMPIIDQLVAANPHALHSLDPMAGVDIREVKRLYGGKIALCGNVNCALMQTGTDDEVVESAEYCLRYGKPGGGYVYCTSNVPFKGLPLDRYLLVLDVWRARRDY